MAERRYFYIAIWISILRDFFFFSWRRRKICLPSIANYEMDVWNNIKWHHFVSLFIGKQINQVDNSGVVAKSYYYSSYSVHVVAYWH